SFCTHAVLTVSSTLSLHDALPISGYVFQVPWSGDLWPRFVESLDYCELEFNENGFPSVLLGTTGKPRRYRTFTVLPRAQLSPSTDRKSTRLNSSHVKISYAVFCLK